MFFRLGRLFRTVGRDLVVLWYACRHSATPFALKIVAVLIALYIFSPIDIIPDWLAFFGVFDDVALLALCVPALLRMMPEQALHDAQSAAESLLSRKRAHR
jgi:uncharacterized membrane protein YkvA (DUF1232 family)